MGLFNRTVIKLLVKNCKVRTKQQFRKIFYAMDNFQFTQSSKNYSNINRTVNWTILLFIELNWLKTRLTINSTCKLRDFEVFEWIKFWFIKISYFILPKRILGMACGRFGHVARHFEWRTNRSNWRVRHCPTNLFANFH